MLTSRLLLPTRNSFGLNLTRTNFFAADSYDQNKLRATTILSIRKENKVVMIGDSQVSKGSVVVKGNSRKLVVIDSGRVLTGGAGSAGDCTMILQALEAKLEEFPGQLKRACVAVTQNWRTNPRFKGFDAAMIVADAKETLLLDGQGDIMEPPDQGILAIGSGGDYAASAATALLETDWDAERIAIKVSKLNKIHNFPLISIIGYEYCSGFMCLYKS